MFSTARIKARRVSNVTARRSPRRVVGLTMVFLIAWVLMPGHASSHREAPLIANDPQADNTDVYAARSPADPDRVYLISNFIPFQYPSGGPNFYFFDPNVQYQIHIDNNGDAVEDITFRWEFFNRIQNEDTFLYNTGVVTSLTDPDLNFRQFYRLTRIDGRQDSGTSTVLTGDIQVCPSHVGLNSMPDYDGLIGSCVNQLPVENMRAFAGQRDEAFYIDIAASFDLLQLRSLNTNFGPPVDGLAGFNVNTVAVEVPIRRLTRNNADPSGPTDPNAIIGVWSTSRRRAVRTIATSGQRTESGDFVQVSRLGNPLVNELVIPRRLKDAFNSLQPTGDAVALPFVQDPEVARLLTALFGVSVPPPPRTDLVTIFLTGIPGVNQPPNVVAAEMQRLNTGVPVTPVGSRSRLGVLGGDSQGYPNGRRVGDDAVDISLQAMAGATPLTPAFQRSPNNALGDGVDQNDKATVTVFPFMPSPHPGLDRFGPQLRNR